SPVAGLGPTRPGRFTLSEIWKHPTVPGPSPFSTSPGATAWDCFLCRAGPLFRFAAFLGATAFTSARVHRARLSSQHPAPALHRHGGVRPGPGRARVAPPRSTGPHTTPRDSLPAWRSRVESPTAPSRLQQRVGPRLVVAELGEQFTCVFTEGRRHEHVAPHR